MSKRVGIWLLLTAVSVFCFSRFGSSQEFKPAPDFTLKDLNNDSLTLSGYKDKKPVLLFFWTTWCPFCLLELRTINDTYAELEKEGLGLIVINVGESRLRIENFLKKYNFSFPIFLDRDEQAVDLFGVLGVPTYILIDRKGYIRSVEHYFPKEKYKDLTSE